MEKLKDLLGLIKLQIQGQRYFLHDVDFHFFVQLLDAFEVQFPLNIRLFINRLNKEKHKIILPVKKTCKLMHVIL